MTSTHGHEITRVLMAVELGDSKALDRLMPLVYNELKAMAQKHMAYESAGHAFQPTALVHEAYLRLLGSGPSGWENRRHFFAAAAESMRRILVDHARMNQRKKRGGDWKRVTLESGIAGKNEETDSQEILALDAALLALKDHDCRMYEIVMLRHFAGLPNDQIAKAINVSSRTVRRDISVARLWLNREMTKRDSDAS